MIEDGPELRPTRLVSIADVAWPVQGPRDSLWPTTPLQQLVAYVALQARGPGEALRRIPRRKQSLALSPLDHLLLEDRTRQFLTKHVADPDAQKALWMMWKRDSPMVNPLLPQGVVEVELDPT